MDSKENWKAIHTGEQKTGFLCRKSAYDSKSKLITWTTLFSFQSESGRLQKKRSTLVTSGLPDPKWKQFQYEEDEKQICDLSLEGLSMQGTQGEKFIVRAIVKNTWPSLGTFMRVRALPRFKGAEFSFGLLRERDLYLDRNAKLVSVGNQERETPGGMQTLWLIEEHFGGKKQNGYWLNLHAEIVVFQSPSFTEFRVPNKSAALEGLPGEITSFAETLTSE
tara:strand:+ start:402 stop:1064 length:663 start_codon:yes stop_codon:yes gene_type:complete